MSQITIKFRVKKFCNEAVVAQGLKRATVNVTTCGFEYHSEERNILYFLALVKKQNAALNAATQYAISREFSGKWGTECPITRFPDFLCLPC